MGNDGGSIPTRDDLVKTKRAAPKADDKELTRQLYAFCLLSKQPLTPPVVSCPLGRLYNKESIISHLLTPSSSASPYGTEGTLLASHIRTLRDLTTLNLTPNPSRVQESDKAHSNMGTQESVRVAPFVDPISLREMNGSVKFLYRHCGCVLSEMTLKEMRKAEGEGGRTDVCPVCAKVDGKEVWERWVTINPKGEEAEMMRDVWEKVREREKEEKKAAKGLKRKKEGGEGERKEKKVKSKEEGPSINKGASVPKLSATLAAQLAESKKSNSPAIASLYAPKDGDPDHSKDGRSTWMTRGAWTRYA